MQNNQRPRFIRATISSRQKPKTGSNKYKMLCLILKRVVNLRMKQYLWHINKYNQVIFNTFSKALQRVERNIQFCKLMSWKQLIFYTRIKKKQQSLLKPIFRLSFRLQRWITGEAFKKIIIYGSRKIGLVNRKVQCDRFKIIKNVMNLVYKKNLLKSFNKIKLFIIESKQHNNKCCVLTKILISLKKNRQYYAWGRILSIGNAEHNDIEHQLGQLNKQMDAMRRELVKKNKDIIELQSKLKYFDQQNPYFPTSKIEQRRNSSLQNSRRSMKSLGSNRRNSSQQLSDKKTQLVENPNNNSILSWLNGSFLSIKSGKSFSKSITGLDCYCKYRQKYNHFKAQASSLKNQLQIIKSQLEVTKDLNEHLQQQMSNLCLITNNQSPQLELLKKQIRDLRKEKQSMKEKLINNQKYIANLKYQFKVKIQNLYRNLKKTN